MAISRVRDSVRMKKQTAATTTTTAAAATTTALNPDIDGSWAWVVLTGTVMNAIIANGQLSAVGIYYVIFLAEFQKSSSFTAWISAAQSASLCFTGPLTSILLSKIGPRLTIICGSLLMTTCYCFAHIANSIPYLILIFAMIGSSHNLIIGGSLSAISLYFRKWSSLATGFMLAGAGVGVVAIGLEVEWAVETFGWRGTMLIQAGLAFQICVFAVLVRGLPSSPESNAKPECAVGNNEIPSISKAVNTNGMPLSKSNVIDTNKVSFKALLKNSVFWLSVVTFLSIQFTISTILTILKGFMINIQLPGSFKLIISLMGAGSILGRLIAGPLSNRICPPLLMSIVGILYCVSSILIVFSKVEWAIASSVFAYGVFQGNVVVSSVVTMSWAFGKTKMPFVRGYIMFFGVISSLSGAPLIGYIIDLTGSYSVAFIFASICALLISTCGILNYFISQRSKNTESQQTCSEIEIQIACDVSRL